MKKVLLCLLLVSCKTTKQYDFKNTKAATPEDAIKAINNTKIKLRRNDSLYLILLFMLLAPLSISAQNCTKTVQEVLVIEESTVVIDNVICIINDAEIVETPCKSSEIVIYPNSTTDFFQIKGLPTGDSEGRVFSLDGRLQKEKINLSGEVNVSDLGPGAYVLKTKLGYQFKFVKL